MSHAPVSRRNLTLIYISEVNVLYTLVTYPFASTTERGYCKHGVMSVLRVAQVRRPLLGAENFIMSMVIGSRREFPKLQSWFILQYSSYWEAEVQDSTEIYNTDEEEFARFNSLGAESSAQDVGCSMSVCNNMRKHILCPV